MPPDGSRKEERKQRALVVDDDTSARTVIADVLRGMGYEVVEASGADEAFRAYLGEAFDLMTLDYRMPGLDGAALHMVLSHEFGGAPAMRDSRDGIASEAPHRRTLPPIIVITAFAEDPTVLRSRFGENIIGTVSKPYVVEELTRMVREQLSLDEDGRTTKAIGGHSDAPENTDSGRHRDRQRIHGDGSRAGGLRGAIGGEWGAGAWNPPG